jgi:hypothetical protein
MLNEDYSIIISPFFTDWVENPVSNSTSIVICVSVAAGSYLSSRCLETALHPTIYSYILGRWIRGIPLSSLQRACLGIVGKIYRPIYDKSRRNLFYNAFSLLQ